MAEFSKEEKVLNAVRQIIAGQMDILDEKVKENLLSRNVIEDLGADSLDIVNIIMEAEELFEIEIEDDDLEKMKTGQDLADHIIQIV